MLEAAWLVPGRAELVEEAARGGIVRIEGEVIVYRHELGRRAIDDSSVRSRGEAAARSACHPHRQIPRLRSG